MSETSKDPGAVPMAELQRVMPGEWFYADAPIGPGWFNDDVNSESRSGSVWRYRDGFGGGELRLEVYEAKQLLVGIKAGVSHNRDLPALAGRMRRAADILAEKTGDTAGMWFSRGLSASEGGGQILASLALLLDSAGEEWHVSTRVDDWGDAIDCVRAAFGKLKSDMEAKLVEEADRLERLALSLRTMAGRIPGPHSGG